MEGLAGPYAPDAAIDPLDAEEHGGDLWAIQAKAYDAADAIKKKDVDSFRRCLKDRTPGFDLAVSDEAHLDPYRLALAIGRS